MTNPEHPPTPEDRDRPRHAAESAARELQPGQAPPEVLARWEEGLTKHGSAFAAYLTLDDVDPHAADILQKFADHHYGSHPDMRSVIDTTIDALGWNDSLANLAQTDPDMAPYLVWNYPDLEERLRDMYDIVERGGQLHLFIR